MSTEAPKDSPEAIDASAPCDSAGQSAALLTLAASCAGGAIEANRIVIEVPAGGAGPEDQADAPRHRRGTLVEAELAIDLSPLGSWFLSRSGAALAAEGLDVSELRISRSDRGAEIFGAVSVAGQHARFVMLGSVQPWGSRFLQLRLDDLFVFGPIGVTAPRLLERLLVSAGARAFSASNDPLPLARIVGSSQLVIDVLAIALIQGLASKGRRLPSLAGSLLEDIELLDDRVRLVFVGAGGPRSRHDSPRVGVPEVRAEDELAALEQSLAGSEPADVVEQLSELVQQTPTDPRMLSRLMLELAAAPLSREHAIRLARELRDREPRAAGTWLAEANIRARGGELDQAAACYRRFADLVAEHGADGAELEARLAVCEYTEADSTESTLDDIRRALEIAPQHARALQHAARIHAELGRWEDLTSIRQRQAAIAKTDAERGRLQLALGELYRVHLTRPHRAVEHYRAALAIQPTSELALSGLAACCIDAEDLTGAVEALDKLAAVATSRGDTATELEALLRAATLLEHDGQAELALQRLERLRAAGHSDPQLSDRLVELLHRLGRSSEASQLIRLQLTREQRPASRAHWQQRLDQLESGEAEVEPHDPPAEAADAGRQTLPRVDEARAVVEAINQAPAAHAPPGRNAQAEIDHWTNVAASLQSKCEQTPDGPEAVPLRLELGRILDTILGRTSEALTIYADAAAIAPTTAEVLEPYADCCYRQQEWSEARVQYTRLYARGAPWSASAELAHRMGIIDEALGDSHDAARWFDRALQREPAHAGALNGAARLAVARGDEEGSYDLLTRLMAVLTVDDIEERAFANEQLGALHLRRGEVEQARALLERSLALDPRRLSAVTLLRDACEKSGDYEGLVAQTEHLMHLISGAQPRAALLRKQAETLATKLSDETRALEYLLRAHDLEPTHLPTTMQLIDHYWAEGDIRTVAELGEEIADPHGGASGDADLRHARVAIALMLSKNDVPAAARWLAPLLSQETLARDALLELGHAEGLAKGVERPALASQVVQLVRGADQSGRAWQTLQELAQTDPRAKPLAGLLETL